MSVSDHHPRHHAREPRLRDMLIQGCFVRRRTDGEVYQVEVAGKHVAAGLKPDQGGDLIWVDLSVLDRDYELVAA